MGESYPALWQSAFTSADEGWVRGNCFIPLSVNLWFDDEQNRVVVRAKEHEVYFYKTMFKTGFQLPFLRVFRELLSHLNLAPHHIMPNGWRCFFSNVALFILGDEHLLTAWEFLAVYQFAKNPQYDAIFTFQVQREGEDDPLASHFLEQQEVEEHILLYFGRLGALSFEVERSSRVTWETRVPFAKAHKHPNLTDKEGDCGEDHGLCSVKKEWKLVGLRSPGYWLQLGEVLGVPPNCSAK